MMSYLGKESTLFIFSIFDFHILGRTENRGLLEYTRLQVKGQQTRKGTSKWRCCEHRETIRSEFCLSVTELKDACLLRVPFLAYGCYSIFYCNFCIFYHLNLIWSLSLFLFIGTISYIHKTICSVNFSLKKCCLNMWNYVLDVESKAATK